jgi:drug/metabolite transporter (DMT)-like permease
LTTPHNRPIIQPYLGLTLGIIAVSAASIIIKAAQGLNVPSLIIAAWRLTLASLLLLPLALAVPRLRDELARLHRGDLGWAALTGVCLGLHFATWITSLEYTSVASSAVFVSTAPLFVALFSTIVWREKLGAPTILGLAVASLGGAIVGLADACTVDRAGIACPPLARFVQGQAVIGDLLALAGAVAMAAYLLIGRRLRSKLSLAAYITLAYGAAAVTLIATALALRLPFLGYPPQAYFWIALLALVPQLIGHSALNWALKYLSATYVSVTVLGEPIGSTVLALIVFDQVPAPLKLLGGVLILAGILLASKPQAKTSEV